MTTGKTVTIEFRHWKHNGTGAVIQRPAQMGPPGDDWAELKNVVAERDRLEREVIEAVKAERIAGKAYTIKLTLDKAKLYHESQDRRRAAVDALLAFEANQK